MPLPGKKKVEDVDRSRLQEIDLTAEERDEVLRGLELFNAREFWQAHEVWEQVWKGRPEESRIFFQGIIQAAAAFHCLLVKRSHTGTVNNMRKALEKLELFPRSFMGFDVAFLRHTLREGLREAEKLGKEKLNEFPNELIPKLKRRRRG